MPAENPSSPEAMSNPYGAGEDMTPLNRHETASVSISQKQHNDTPESDKTPPGSVSPTQRTPQSSSEDSIIVEVVAPQREWNRVRHATPQKTIIPVRKGHTPRLQQGKMVRFIRQIADAKNEGSPLLSRFGKVAGGLTSLTDHSTVSVGLTSTHYGNKQAMTAIALASVWARYGHRTLLVNLDPNNRNLVKAVGRTSPTLGDLTEAMVSGKQLPLPPLFTDATDHLEFLSGYEDEWNISRLADTGLLQQIHYILRTRYQRMIWSLPPTKANEWSPVVFRSVFDSFALSAKRGRADLTRLGRLAEELEIAEFPPLQVIWHE